MYCNIIVTKPFDQVFTYKLKKGQTVKKGSVVNVPFGKAENQIGMVMEVLDSVDNLSNYKIKSINIPEKGLFNSWPKYFYCHHFSGRGHLSFMLSLIHI